MKVYKVTVDTSAAVYLEIYNDWEIAKSRAWNIVKERGPSILERLKSYHVDVEKTRDFQVEVDGWRLVYINREGYLKVMSEIADLSLTVLVEAADVDTEEPLGFFKKGEKRKAETIQNRLMPVRLSEETEAQQLTFLQNLLKDGFKKCIGLAENQVLRIYVDTKDTFHMRAEEKEQSAVDKIGGVPARVIASFAAIPKEKYMRYWRIRMGGFGAFTEEDYTDVVSRLLSDYMKENTEHARRALTNYRDFLETGKPDYNIYVLSIEANGKRWMEFYGNKEKALERTEYYLTHDLKMLGQMAKAMELPISFIHGDVVTNEEFTVKKGIGHDQLVLIHRDGKLAMQYESYTNQEHHSYILKVRPYEVNSGESYNAFDVLNGSE